MNCILFASKLHEKDSLNIEPQLKIDTNNLSIVQNVLSSAIQLRLHNQKARLMVSTMIRFASFVSNNVDKYARCLAVTYQCVMLVQHRLATAQFAVQI